MRSIRRRLILAICLLLFCRHLAAGEPTLAPPTKATQTTPLRLTFEVAEEPSEPATQLFQVSTEGCAPCARSWEILRRVCKPDVGWYLDADKNAAWCQLYGVTGPYPQLLLFRHGVLIGRRTGVQSEADLRAWIAEPPGPPPSRIPWLRIWSRVQPLAMPLPEYAEEVDAYVDRVKEPIAARMKEELKTALPHRTRKLP